MKFIGSILLSGAALFAACEAYAADTVMVDENGLGLDESKQGDIVGYRRGRPIFLGGDPTLEVYRGTKSVPGEFPAAGWIGNCTANAVALDVVFTAGHCKGTGARISFQHRQSGESYAATCTRHPRYNTRTIYNDWTLCKLDRPLPADSVLLEFAIDQAPAVQTNTFVNGFGAPNVGVHYWGNAKITQSSSAQDLVTCGPANLGGGDSGGSLIAVTPTRHMPEGSQVFGVNSRGNSSCSWYNRVSHSEFISWAKEYEQDKGVKLCGVSADCRTPPDPLDCPALYMELADCIVDAERAPYNKSQSCSEKYDIFKACIRQ